LDLDFFGDPGQDTLDGWALLVRLVFHCERQLACQLSKQLCHNFHKKRDAMLFFFFCQRTKDVPPSMAGCIDNSGGVSGGLKMGPE